MMHNNMDDVTVRGDDEEVGMSDELKPCPFCGGVAKLMKAPEYWVRCTVCLADGTMVGGPKAATSVWNRRADDLKG